MDNVKSSVNCLGGGQFLTSIDLVEHVSGLSVFAVLVDKITSFFNGKLCEVMSTPLHVYHYI